MCDCSTRTLPNTPPPRCFIWFLSAECRTKLSEICPARSHVSAHRREVSPDSVVFFFSRSLYSGSEFSLRDTSHIPLETNVDFISSQCALRRWFCLITLEHRGIPMCSTGRGCRPAFRRKSSWEMCRSCKANFFLQS